MFSGLLLLFALSAFGGQDPEQPARREIVVVTGTYEPAPLDEIDRSVRALPVNTQSSLLYASPGEYLRLDPSFDLRARAPSGVQTDISIRGGSFGQTLVLLDGLRLNDAQSGHHSMNLPVPLESLERIEILKGSGSAQHGSDAVGGVVNLISRTAGSAEFRLRGALGNFGVNRESGLAGAVWRSLSQRFSFARDFSAGFIPNRDYRSLALSSVTRLRTRLGASAVVLAHADRRFGAEQFYGDFNSWERTRTWFASARQELGQRMDAAMAFRRHTDLFVLHRDRPQIYTNRHEVESWQATLHRREALSSQALLSYGGEFLRDAIRSSNLGRHRRHRGALWAALDVRSLRRFSFVLGAREEFYPGGRQFSPTLSGGFWTSAYLKLRASASHAFRVPAYTDLYYHDPANVGSPDLRPERAWSYEAGADAYAGHRVRASATVFHRRERDVIDYVRRIDADIWRAANFQRIRFTGLEAGVTVQPAGRAHTLDIRYTGLSGAGAATAGIRSKYVFNHPVHSALAAWDGSLGRGWMARVRSGVLARLGRDPYAVVDAALAYARGRWRPFAQFGNIGGARYHEVPGVPMPGRTVVGGVEIVLIGQN